MKEKIKQELEKIRPSLQADGGDVNFVSFDAEKGIVKVELTGQCAHCPMADITLKQGIEYELKQSIPEVKLIKAI
ncbi:MAG: NifU family protein [bacterium]